MKTQSTPADVRNLAIRRFPFASEMILPLRQNFGTVARPIVREGQEVVRGEPIAEPIEFLSVALHAPATGVIDRIDECVTVDGSTEPCIVLRVYPGASQEILYGANVDVDALSPADIVKAIRMAGIVGQGGLGFPVHALLDLPAEQYVDAIAVNACEPAPDSAVTRRILLERSNDVARGLQLLMKAANAQQAVIAVQPGQDDAAKALQKALPASVGLVTAAEPYRQGSAKRLVQAALGREVPEDGLPLDVHAAVTHVATLALIGELLPRTGGFIEHVVTIAGAGVAKPGNYLLPVGTPLGFALEQAGAQAVKEVYLAGPAPTTAVKDMATPLTKEVTGVFSGRPASEPPAATNGTSNHKSKSFWSKLLPQRIS